MAIFSLVFPDSCPNLIVTSDEIHRFVVSVPECINIANRYQWWIQDFPEEGAPTPRGGGAPTYDFAKFSQKQHEIERISTGGGHVPRAPLDPPLVTHDFLKFSHSVMLHFGSDHILR